MPNPCICYHKFIVFNIPIETAPKVWEVTLTSVWSASRHALFSSFFAILDQSFLPWVPVYSQFQLLTHQDQFLFTLKMLVFDLFYIKTMCFNFQQDL